MTLPPPHDGCRLRLAPPSWGGAARARGLSGEPRRRVTRRRPVCFLGEKAAVFRGAAPAPRRPERDGRGLTGTRYRPRRRSGPPFQRAREAERAGGTATSLPLPGPPRAFPRVHACSPPAPMHSHASHPAGPNTGPFRAPRPGGLAGARGPAAPSRLLGGHELLRRGAERGRRDGCLCPRERPVLQGLTLQHRAPQGRPRFPETL